MTKTTSFTLFTLPERKIMNFPHSTIVELPDFDIEFPDEYIDEFLNDREPTEAELKRADRILGMDDSTVGYESYDEWQGRESLEYIEEDWAL